MAAVLVTLFVVADRLAAHRKPPDSHPARRHADDRTGLEIGFEPSQCQNNSRHGCSLKSVCFAKMHDARLHKVVGGENSWEIHIPSENYCIVRFGMCHDFAIGCVRSAEIGPMRCFEPGL